MTQVEKAPWPNVPDRVRIKPLSKILHLLSCFDFKFEVQLCLWLLGNHIELIIPTIRKNKAETKGEGLPANYTHDHW